MFKIREAVIGDAEELQEVSIKTWMDEFASEISIETANKTMEETRNLDYIKKSIEKYLTLLAIEEKTGKIVGYIQITTLDKIMHDLFDTSEQDRQLDRCYVLQDFHEQGIGTALITAALAHEYSANAPKIYLDVDDRNPRAQHVYAKFGFKDTGEIIPFYDNGEQSGFDHIFVLDRSL